ncbi:MAG: permease [Phycisphaerae bacterium]
MADRSSIRKLLWFVAVFLLLFFLPLDWTRVSGAVIGAVRMAQYYARRHVLFGLIPAFFLAGGITCFIRRQEIMKYLSATAPRPVSYAVASVSGGILTVCSCTVLPLFAGIYRMGAGIGPASAFLYSGPAINVLAIVLTFSAFGWRLGVARIVGAIGFAVIIGVCMERMFQRSEGEPEPLAAQTPDAGDFHRRPWQTAVLFAVILVLIALANWARSGDVRASVLCCPDGLTMIQQKGRIVGRTDESTFLRTDEGTVKEIPNEQITEIRSADPNLLDRFRAVKWILLIAFAAGLVLMLIFWFRRTELKEWVENSWQFAQQILPLLLWGVLLAGFLLGKPGQEGLIPSRWIEMILGDDPRLFLSATGLTGSWAEGPIQATWDLWTNLFASVCGIFMYFATLTEIPIVEGLRGADMGEGPSLALLLAGPALSLPNMLVIRSIIGIRKTVAYCSLVVIMATISGVIYGAIVS